jgi:hypothetical protein
MASCLNTSIDAALAYARATVGHATAARLLRAAAFADEIEDDRDPGPQVAAALVRAVEQRTECDAALWRQDTRY